jgi:hypothetical protein
MPASLFKSHTQRKITGSFLLLVFVFVLMTQALAAATSHQPAPSTCNSEMTQEHHPAMSLSTGQMDAAESDDCSDADSGCWQCSYCSTLINSVRPDLLQPADFICGSQSGASHSFSTRLERPPKPFPV